MKLQFLHSFFLMCCLLAPALLFGQSDTTFQIETIEITTSNIRENEVGAIAKKWNTESLSNSTTSNIAELLGADTDLFIKSYGAGSLATSSIRGGSAGHTLVLWNGMPIQSPMLGLLDLSLLPSQAVEEIVLLKGGNSTMFGSGAIGGIIALNNLANFDSKLNANFSATVGSFNHFDQQIKLSQGNSRFQSVTKFSNLQADNNFYYPIADGFPKRQQTNAEVSQQNIHQDFYWRPNYRHELSLHFWRQLSKRQIPPTNVQTRSEAHQNDATTRVLLQAKTIKNNYSLNAKFGFADEHLDFFDDQSNLVSLSRFINYNGELGAQWTIKNKHLFYIGVNDVFTKVWTEGYETTKSEHNAAAFASFQFNFEHLVIKTSLRENFRAGLKNKPVPEIAVDYAFSSKLMLKIKASKNFRLPTFNDRYWSPGGNEDLLPESGWSQEASILFDQTTNKSNFTAAITVFNRNIDNWIIWIPRSGQAFWSASNISKVWSRGLESKVGFGFKLQEVQFNLGFNYSHIRSTHQASLTIPRIEKGVQLLYTPIHQASAKIGIQWRQLSMTYRHNYFSNSRGVNEAIPSYKTADITLHYQSKIKQKNNTLFLSINNIYNKNYLIIERRPMPGINFKIGLRLTINSPKGN